VEANYQQAPAKLCVRGENTVNHLPMTGDRTEAAVQRIEAALARIAQAADRARDAAPPAPPPAPPSVSALVERHESLREKVAQALGKLDALLEEIEQ
jgi:hypothetical protein